MPQEDRAPPNRPLDTSLLFERVPAVGLPPSAAVMPRGRPRGSTGNYFRWSPERIADLWQDADILASKQGRVNRAALARLLKQKFPDKYRYDTVEQLRQQLFKAYERNKTKLDDLDAFNAAVLAQMLGETE